MSETVTGSMDGPDFIISNEKAPPATQTIKGISAENRAERFVMHLEMAGETFLDRAYVLNEMTAAFRHIAATAINDLHGKSQPIPITDPERAVLDAVTDLDKAMGHFAEMVMDRLTGLETALGIAVAAGEDEPTQITTGQERPWSTGNGGEIKRPAPTAEAEGVSLIGDRVEDRPEGDPIHMRPGYVPPPGPPPEAEHPEG